MARPKEYMNTQFSPFTAKNKKQKEYFNALDNFSITVGYGCAGTGKTAVAVSKAAEDLYSGKVKKIIISRPAVEAAGENLGFLPGDVSNKFEPYLAPVKGILDKVLGKSHVDCMIRNEVIQAIPLAYCRGLTFDDSWMILDEAQNATIEQVKMFTTRVGMGSKISITGDYKQSDISGRNGLEDAIHRFSWIPSFKAIRFEREDIVRSGLISDILSAYED